MMDGCRKTDREERSWGFPLQVEAVWVDGFLLDEDQRRHRYGWHNGERILGIIYLGMRIGQCHI